MYKYKGIVFAKDYNKSLAEFKEDFGSNHIFKKIPHLDRDKELKKVYNALMAHNGKFHTSPKKGKTDKASKGKE